MNGKAAIFALAVFATTVTPSPIQAPTAKPFLVGNDFVTKKPKSAVSTYITNDHDTVDYFASFLTMKK